MTATPNHALQRTAPGVTVPAPPRPAAQELRCPPQSLSLEWQITKGLSRIHGSCLGADFESLELDFKFFHQLLEGIFLRK